MRKQWIIAGAIFLAGVINYLDRAALSIVAPRITQELGLSATQLGTIFSLFFVGYTVSCFPGGAAADRFGAKRVLLVAMVSWSLLCGLTGVAGSFAGLLIIRLLFGMAEGPYLSSSAKLIGAWFEPARRATVLGMSQAGPSLGGAIAGPIIGFLTIWAGWRVAFWAVAALGIAWAVSWAALGRDRPQDAQLTPATGTPRLDTQALHGIGFYVRKQSFIGVAVGYFAFAYLLYFFITWFPSYLTNVQRMDLREMALVSAIPWLLGALGQVTGGLAADWMLRRTGDAVESRRTIAVICLGGAAGCIGLMIEATSPGAAVALMAAAVFLTQASASSYFGTILDTVEPARVGSVGGLLHTIANSAGIVAPVVTGVLIDRSGSYVSAFACAGSVAFVGAVCVAVLVRGTGSVPSMAPAITASH